MTPRQDEPAEDEDEFYYGLNRRNAEKQDTPFSGWAIAILLGGLSIIPLCVVAAFLSPVLGYGVLILLFLLFFLLPVIFVVILLFGSVALSSILQMMRRIFKLR